MPHLILRACLPLLPSARSADIPAVVKIVAVVICVTLGVPLSGSATAGTGSLLGSAAKLSGLAPRRPVPTAKISGTRYDSLLARSRARDYPRSLRLVDARLYARLGLTSGGVQLHLVAGVQASRAWYDPAGRRLLLRRKPMAGRAKVIHELVRALVDQHYGLRRISGLRARDRDRAIAAQAIVEGTAALASGLRARGLRGSPLDRFLELEYTAGLGPGRALASELRYLGGRAALGSALRTFPQTTEQLLHVDKFLEREPALTVRLPSQVGVAMIRTAESFGELDARNLLRAFHIRNAAAAAAGWGGGRIGLYDNGHGDDLAALALRWDTPEDAAEWRDAFSAYLAAAFPGEMPRDCPPLDRCWSGPADLAVGMLGETTVFAAGPGSDAIAATLLVQG